LGRDEGEHMSDQEIDIRPGSGGVEYTRPLILTEISTPPKDIAADTVRLSLGSLTTPGEWFVPDTDTPGADTAGAAASVQNQRTVQLLVAIGYTPGDFWLWSQIADGPERVVRRHFPITIIGPSTP
jgi:hypothetical protein